MEHNTTTPDYEQDRRAVEFKREVETRLQDVERRLQFLEQIIKIQKRSE